MLLSDIYSKAEKLLRVGRLAEARVQIERCIKSAPELPEPYTLAGIIALNQQKYDQAFARFKKGLNLSTTPEGLARNYVGQGRCLAVQGEYDRSLLFFNEAIRAHSHYAPAYEDAADAYMRLGNYEKGSTAAKAALKINDSPRAKIILARCLLFQGSGEEAEVLLRKIDRRSGLAFEVNVLLAGIDRARGKVKEAAQKFSALSSERPYFPVYYELAKSKTFDSTDRDFKKMLAVYNEVRSNGPLKLPPKARLELEVDLEFALGKVEEDLGVFDDSYKHYVAANRLHQGIEATNYQNIKETAEKLTRIDYEKISDSSRRFVTDKTLRPLMIVSLPRAGASLLEQIIGGHQDVFQYGETGPLMRFFREKAQRGSIGAADFVGNTFEVDLFDVLEGYSKSGWSTDKSLDSFLYLDIVRAIFCEARFILMERHPMDILWSQFSQNFAPGLGWTYSFESIIGYMTFYRKVVEDWKKRYPEVYKTIYYEELVTHPQKVTQQIFEFIGLEYQQNCLRFYERDNYVWTASNAQVREPINLAGRGRWLNYERELSEVYGSIKDWCDEYERRLGEIGVPAFLGK